MLNNYLGTRTLRAKEKKSYHDNLEDEIEGKRRFDVQEKLNSSKYVFEDGESFIRKMEGKDFDLQFIQEHGFSSPIKFPCKDGLGLRMPNPETFDLNDVKSYVGARRMVDVVDSNTQQSMEMTMSQWTKYFLNPKREKILNVISLEFSHTGMDHFVEPPEVVRKIDWVNVMWPPELIQQQTDTTNNLDLMKYPKVKKYVLMSVAGCYTDFHIDFGGTSVWYHIIKGEKIFWMIEPNDANLSKYEKWTLSTKQEDVFFGDLVDKCCIVHLRAGDTFMIPSGWIHAVYTPSDSLVFGGNFIHSYSIEMQIRISEIEHKTKVPNRFRFPFYPQIHWYAAKRYTELLEKDVEQRSSKTQTGNLDSSDTELIENKENLGSIKNDVKKLTTNVKIENGNSEHDMISGKLSLEKNEASDALDDKEAVSKDSLWEPVYLTDFEVNGLKRLIERLRTWDRAIGNCPAEISGQEALLGRLEELVEIHEKDDPWLATKGIDIFDQFDKYLEETGCATPTIRQRQKAKRTTAVEKSKTNQVKKPRSKPTKASRKRRLRCFSCAGCTRDNCGECKYCLDMPKFGGPGKMKQTCVFRICLNPTLPSSAKCSVCGTTKVNEDDPIMECSICASLAHPNCFERKGPCKISDRLNNCWECPNCCQDEEAGDFDPNLVRGKMDPLKKKLAASVGSTQLNESDLLKKRRRRCSSPGGELSKSKRMKKAPAEISMSATETDSDNGSESGSESSSESGSDSGSESGSDSGSESGTETEEEMEQCQPPAKGPKRLIQKERPRPLPVALNTIEPKHVVRPRPISPPPNDVEVVDGSKHPLEKDIWLRIFGHLSQSELCLCMRVCRTWNRWAMMHGFWTFINASEKKINSFILEGIVRRQPMKLSLSHSNVTYNQIKWLTARLPRLIYLDLKGNTSSSIAALFKGVFPPLYYLDMSWCENVTDDVILDLLCPSSDGLFPKRNKSRLGKLKELSLAGCDVTDKSLRYISKLLPSLEKLDVSYCNKITDLGVDALTSDASICRDVLKEVDLSGCKNLTSSSLQYLTQCAKEPRVVIERCDQLLTVA